MSASPNVKKFSIRQLGAKAKKSSHVLRQSENELQKAAEQYLALKKIRYIHLPKGAQRFLWNKKYGIPVQVAAEASRALKGVPDLVIFGRDNTFLLIELKSETGKPTPEQLGWMDYGLMIVRDFDTFQEIIDSWAKLHNRLQ